MGPAADGRGACPGTHVFLAVSEAAAVGFAFTTTHRASRGVRPDRWWRHLYGECKSEPRCRFRLSQRLYTGTDIRLQAHDTVVGMENRNLDAMFMYTVTMGLVGVLMAWIIFVLALKGWAVRKEAGRMARSHKLT